MGSRRASQPCDFPPVLARLSQNAKGSGDYAKSVEAAILPLCKKTSSSSIALLDKDIAMLSNCDKGSFSSRQTNSQWSHRLIPRSIVGEKKGHWEYDFAVLANMQKMIPRDPLCIFDDQTIDKLPDYMESEAEARQTTSARSITALRASANASQARPTPLTFRAEKGNTELTLEWSDGAVAFRGPDIEEFLKVYIANTYCSKEMPLERQVRSPRSQRKFSRVVVKKLSVFELIRVVSRSWRGAWQTASAQCPHACRLVKPRTLRRRPCRSGSSSAWLPRR